MRIESFKITPQQTSGNQRIIRLLVWLYTFSLRLYPAAFQAAFADEMRDVFMMSVREALMMGGLTVWFVMWREVSALPMNVARVRWQAVGVSSEVAVWRARHVTRWSSFILSAFMLRHLIISLSSPYTLAVDGIRLSMFFVLLFLTSVSMLLAWRWERVGGLLTIGGGTALGAFLMFYIAYFRPVEISLVGLALIGVLWALPFVAFGAMFYHLSQRPAPYLCVA